MLAVGSATNVVPLATASPPSAPAVGGGGFSSLIGLCQMASAAGGSGLPAPDGAEADVDIAALPPVEELDAPPCLTDPGCGAVPPVPLAAPSSVAVDVPRAVNCGDEEPAGADEPATGIAVSGAAPDATARQGGTPALGAPPIPEPDIADRTVPPAPDRPVAVAQAGPGQTGPAEGGELTLDRSTLSAAAPRHDAGAEACQPHDRTAPAPVQAAYVPGPRDAAAPDAATGATVAASSAVRTLAGAARVGIDLARTRPAAVASDPSAEAVAQDDAAPVAPPVLPDMRRAEAAAPIAGDGSSGQPATVTEAGAQPAEAAVGVDAPSPQAPAERAAPTFEAQLAKAAEAPPPPRSPLVQAAVERLAPLPATTGETVVRLNPHGLGLIEVVIHEGQNGALDVALRVQNPLVLEAMRQERDAVAVVFSPPQGGAEGALSMDLMQSGARQGGGGSDPRGQSRQAGQTAQEGGIEDPAEMQDRQILSTDRVNIVT